MIGIYAKNGYQWNPITSNFECEKKCKIRKYLDIKSRSCKKRLFGKLVSAREYEMLNTIETLFIDKKVTYGSYCPIHIIPMVIIYLLLLVAISINCYYYYTKHWLKNERVLSC